MNLVELRSVGQRRVYVDLGSITRIATSESMGPSDMATPERPLYLIFKDGGDVEVFGVSVIQLLGNANAVADAKGERRPFSVIFIDDPMPSMGGHDE